MCKIRRSGRMQTTDDLLVFSRRCARRERRRGEIFARNGPRTARKGHRSRTWASGRGCTACLLARDRAEPARAAGLLKTLALIAFSLGVAGTAKRGRKKSFEIPADCACAATSVHPGDGKGIVVLTHFPEPPGLT